MILFRAMEKLYGQRYRVKLDLGWRGIASDVDVFDVPETHHPLLREPKVRFLARILQRSLEDIS